MGETAARILIQRVEGLKNCPEVAVAPEFMVRETTAPPIARSSRPRVKARLKVPREWNKLSKLCG